MTDRRSSAGDFRHNARVAWALIPSLVVLAGFGGTIPVGAGLVGAMITYTLDAMRIREGALLAVWATLSSVNLCFWAAGGVFGRGRPLLLSLLIGACISMTLVITGVWATLQFRWLKLRYPIAVLAGERLLLSGSFAVAATVQAWGAVAAVGAPAAPFWTAPLLCGLYALLARPLETSFRGRGAGDASIGGKASPELRVQGGFEGFCCATAAAALPAGLYAAVHAPGLGEWRHVWSLALLASAPMLFLGVLEDGLWWLPVGPGARLAARQVLCAVSLATALAGLEGRLIFPAFGQYIHAHPPWNYMLVTTALYGAAVLAVASVGGLIDEAASSLLAAGALLVSAGLGGAAAGMPLLAISAPLLAAAGLILFLDSRQLRDYAVFVAGGSATAAWFIHHHFWFLDVRIQGLSLQSVCVLIWLAAVLALLVPGVVMCHAHQTLLSSIFLLEAVLVAALEEKLYLGPDGAEGEIYPAAMVLATSALGVAAVRRLRALDALGSVATWLLHGVFAAKLSMLLLPQGKLPVPLFILILAATAPARELTQGQPHAAALKQSSPHWWAAAHALAVAGATLHARYAIYDVLALALGARPSEGTLLGVLVLVAAAGCARLGTADLPKSRGVRRRLVLVAASGLLLLVFRPPLPLQGGAVCPAWLPSPLCFRLWDRAHVPEHEVDDDAIWAEYGERRDRRPLWLLVAAAATALATATRRAPAADSLARGLALSALGGGSIGGYIALEFFPGQLTLQIVIGVATLAVAGVLVSLRIRGAASPALLGLLLAAWAAALPLGLLVEAAAPLPVLPEDARRLFGDADTLIEQQRQDVNRAALLAVCCAEALLVAFAIKLRVSAALAAASPVLPDANTHAATVLRLGNAYAGRAAQFLGNCLPQSTGGTYSRSNSVGAAAVSQGRMGSALAQLSSEGLGWLPTAGNVITLACLGLSLVLNGYLASGSNASIFILAPVLLLLNQDALLSALDSRRRYFPVSTATSAYLLLSSVKQAFGNWLAAESLTNRSASSTVALLKNLWLAAAAVPCHFYFNQYLWSRQQVDTGTLLLIAPINAAGVAFADPAAVRLLAASGMLMCAVQYVAMRRVRREGLKLI